MLDPEMGMALETWLRLLRPTISSAEIKASLIAKFRGLKLEVLPLKKALFIFDSALIDTQKAIPMIDAARGGSWIPLFIKRLNMIDDHDFEGWDRLRKLMIYLNEIEVSRIERQRISKSNRLQAEKAADDFDAGHDEEDG
jgi:hypothetical protein